MSLLQLIDKLGPILLVNKKFSRLRIPSILDPYEKKSMATNY